MHKSINHDKKTKNYDKIFTNEKINGAPDAAINYLVWKRAKERGG
jgi:hypothetical protein